MKILLDTNIILDILLKRQPYSETAAKILKVSDFNKIHLFISASMATDVYYVIRKVKGRDIGLALLKDLLNIIDVCKVDKNILILALESDFNDFEDAVQNYAGLEADIEVIITRNKKDYVSSALNIMDSEEFVRVYIP